MKLWMMKKTEMMTMTLESLVRILKLNGNCNVSAETLKKYGKTRIEKECGFKITVKESRNCETNYILEKK